MKKVSAKLHLVSVGADAFLYHPDSFVLAKIGPDDAERFQAWEAGESDPALEEQLTALMESLNGREIAVRKDEKPIGVYLHVSNACNLKCTYCYANGGSYNSPPGVMSEETAKAAVDRFYSTQKEIGSFTFFGGEPMMQARLIRKVCDYILEKAKTLGAPQPHFTTVTNGTLLTEEIVQLLHKYEFGMTVSIDGPADINDLLRPTVRDKGSFRTIEGGLRRLQDVGIVPNIEATFTAKHMEQGYTPQKLLAYFRDTFGVRTITIAPVSDEPTGELAITPYYDRLIPQYREAARFSLETLKTDRPIVLFQVAHVLRLFLLKHRNPPNQFCYANLGKDLFAVSSEGNVYPCQMMNDQEPHNMGNIRDADFGHTEKFDGVRGKFEEMTKPDMQCQACWARHLCFMCIAGVEVETGKLRPIPKHRCDLIRGVIDEILSFVGREQSDPTVWGRICKNILGETNRDVDEKIVS